MASSLPTKLTRLPAVPVLAETGDASNGEPNNFKCRIRCLADVTLPVTAGHSELPDKKKVAYFFARKKL